MPRTLLVIIGLSLLLGIFGCRGCSCSGGEEAEEAEEVAAKSAEQPQEADRPQTEGEEVQPATAAAEDPGEEKTEKRYTKKIDLLTGKPVVEGVETGSKTKVKACPATMRAMATLKKTQEERKRREGTQAVPAASSVSLPDDRLDRMQRPGKRRGKKRGKVHLGKGGARGVKKSGRSSKVRSHQ